ncbi:MAG: beta-N-acetylglucosaminidase domain-containing protein [Microbacteriaceae bacterium]|nr:beta-N-acetylglucosaminidase domain-containing protein [Microbacteriaceae bacterium]
MTGALPIRGVIEGFYGTPWTHAQRLDMIDFVASIGMNTFVYAPKDDALLRRDWRMPYSGPALDALAALIERCRSGGVGFVFALSPGLSMRYSEPADLDALLTKYRQVLELGATGIALLLDDIPPRLQHPGDVRAFPSLVAAQVVLVGRVHDALPSVPLMVAPTRYWGKGDEPEIVELGRGLDPAIDIFWTGRAICSPELEEADARGFLAATGHAPLYWDNFPVNDVAMTGELHIGPYLGRDPGLAGIARGVIANAMPLAESSKVGLSSVAEYANDPAGFDPEAAWERALERVAGADLDAVRTFADAFRGSALCTDDSPRLADALARFAFEVEFGDRAGALEALADEARGLSGVAERMRGIANAALAREAEPWIAQYARAAEGLALCAEVLASSPVEPADRERVMAHLRELRSHRLRVHGDLVDMFLSDTAHEFG